MNDGDSKGLTLSFQKIWTKGGYKKKFKGYFVIYHITSAWLKK
jgi:hypothetical protein